MNFKNLDPRIELLRPVNLAIVFMTVAVAGVLAKPSGLDWLLIIVASIAASSIAGGGNAINDYFDIKTDKINRPDRPLPRGALKLGDARRLWITTSAFGLVLSLLLGIWGVVIAVVWVGGLYFYSQRLKGTVVAGNVAVAFMTALAFPFGAAVAGRPDLGIYPAIFAFLANLARELLKDVEDVDGDATVGAETLPVKHGPEAGLLGASIAIGVLILTTFVPFVAGVYDLRYLLVVLFVNLALAYVIIAMWYDSTLSNLKRLSLILKVCMVAGIFAVFLGS
ncbi:MAG: geranylgeranylglycerol-phosphate geranylgeranyltransferase [Ignavibacteriales bacterium]|nr:geranylgeranylglycerol-phosphate geranylgeranyltransferase [Ignavibacteriales bacterium]